MIDAAARRQGEQQKTHHVIFGKEWGMQDYSARLVFFGGFHEAAVQRHTGPEKR